MEDLRAARPDTPVPVSAPYGQVEGYEALERTPLRPAHQALVFQGSDTLRSLEVYGQSSAVREALSPQRGGAGAASAMAAAGVGRKRPAPHDVEVEDGDAPLEAGDTSGTAAPAPKLRKLDAGAAVAGAEAEEAAAAVGVAGVGPTGGSEGDIDMPAPPPASPPPPACPHALALHMLGSLEASHAAVLFVDGTPHLFVPHQGFRAFVAGTVQLSASALLRLCLTGSGWVELQRMHAALSQLTRLERRYDPDKPQQAGGKLAAAAQAVAEDLGRSALLPGPQPAKSKRATAKTNTIAALTNQVQQAALGMPNRMDTLPKWGSPFTVVLGQLAVTVLRSAAAGRVVDWAASVQGIAGLLESAVGRYCAAALNLTHVQVETLSTLSPAVVTFRRAVAGRQGILSAADTGIATVTTGVTVLVVGDSAATPLAAAVPLPQTAGTSTTNARWRQESQQSTRLLRAYGDLAGGGRRARPLHQAVLRVSQLRHRGKLGRASAHAHLDPVAVARGLVVEAARRSGRVHARLMAALPPASRAFNRAIVKLQLHWMYVRTCGEVRHALSWARSQAIRNRGAASAALWKRLVRGGDVGRGHHFVPRHAVIAMGDGLHEGAQPGTRGGKHRTQASMTGLASAARVQLRWSIVAVAECWTSQAHPRCGGHASNPRAVLWRRKEDGTVVMRAGTCFRALRCAACKVSGNRDGWAARNIAGVAVAAVVRMPPMHALRYGPLWAPRHTAGWERLIRSRRH